MKLLSLYSFINNGGFFQILLNNIFDKKHNNFIKKSFEYKFKSDEMNKKIEEIELLNNTLSHDNIFFSNLNSVLNFENIELFNKDFDFSLNNIKYDNYIEYINFIKKYENDYYKQKKDIRELIHDKNTSLELFDENKQTFDFFNSNDYYKDVILDSFNRFYNNKKVFKLQEILKIIENEGYFKFNEMYSFRFKIKMTIFSAMILKHYFNLIGESDNLFVYQKLNDYVYDNKGIISNIAEKKEEIKLIFNDYIYKIDDIKQDYEQYRYLKQVYTYNNQYCEVFFNFGLYELLRMFFLDNINYNEEIENIINSFRYMLINKFEWDI